MSSLDKFGIIFNDLGVCVTGIASRTLSCSCSGPGEWNVSLSGSSGWNEVFSGDTLEGALLSAALHANMRVFKEHWNHQPNSNRVLPKRTIMLTLEEFGKVFRDCKVRVDSIASCHFSEDFVFPGDWAVVLSGSVDGEHWRRAFSGPTLEEALRDAALYANVCEERVCKAFAEHAVSGVPTPEAFLHPLLYEYKKEFAELCRQKFSPMVHVDVRDALLMLKRLNLEQRGAVLFVKDGQTFMGIWSMRVRDVRFLEPVFLVTPVKRLESVLFERHFVSASMLEDLRQGDGRYSFPASEISENLPSAFADIWPSFDAWFQFEGSPLPYLHSGLLSEHDKALVGRDGAWIMLRDGDTSLILSV